MADILSQLLDDALAALEDVMVDGGLIEPDRLVKRRQPLELLVDPDSALPVVAIWYGTGFIEPRQIGVWEGEEGTYSIEVDLWVPETDEYVDQYPDLHLKVREALMPLAMTRRLTWTREQRGETVVNRPIPYSRTVFVLEHEEV